MGDLYNNPPQSRNEAILRATIDGTEYTDPPESRIEDLLLELKETIGEGGSVEANPEGIASETLSKLKVDDTIYSIPSGGGGGGTSDYTALENKPEINGVTLAGDKSAADLGLVGAETGKGLSSNDYTNADKAIVEGVTAALADKVDKVAGKGLSTNDFTDAAKDKLDGIAAGAEVNVQPDWNESNSESDAFIKNKPTIPAAQVNADWEASSGKAEILHKPTLGTAAAKDSTSSVAAGSTDLVESGAVAAAIGDKATKVSGATSGNFASLTSGGDIADSGKKASDFMASDGVEANPTGTATGTLTKLGIGSDIYDIQGSGGADKADISAIGTNEAGATASKAYAIGEHFYKNGKFCTCIQAIAQGATFTLGTNYEEGCISDNIGYYIDVDLNGTVVTSLADNMYYGIKTVEKLSGFYPYGWCWLANKWDTAIIEFNVVNNTYFNVGILRNTSKTYTETFLIRVFLKR